MSQDLPADFFQRLVADCPDAVIYADASGSIRYWNAAATRIFGFSEDEALGRGLTSSSRSAAPSLGRA